MTGRFSGNDLATIPFALLCFACKELFIFGKDRRYLRTQLSSLSLLLPNQEKRSWH